MYCKRLVLEFNKKILKHLLLNDLSVRLKMQSDVYYQDV